MEELKNFKIKESIERDTSKTFQVSAVLMTVEMF